MRTAWQTLAWLCFACALPLQLAAQPDSGGFRPVAARPMRFEQVSLEQGLSQSFVNCILEDRTGFLWVGTQSGLNRYDGYGFTVYRHEGGDPASLPHDWILALLEGPEGDLWIGTEGGGLARWRRGSDSFTAYRHETSNPQSLSGDWVVALAWDRSGWLWVGTRDSGLNRLDPASGEVERYVHDPADPGSLSSDKTFALHVDRSGDLWVGTAGGLDRFDEARQAFSHYRHDPADPSSLSDDRVRTILEDDHGVLWVGSHGGLNRFEAASGRFERFLHDPAEGGSLSHDWVRTLFEDRDGRLWVGTDGGLNLWQPESRGFASYRHDPGDSRSLGADQVISIAQDSSGILWLGTIGGGLSRWNPATWSFPLYASGEAGASNPVFAVSEDSDGGLWIGTFGGLEQLDRATGERTRYTHDPRDGRSLGDDRVTALLHDRDGALWVGTVGGGVNLLLEDGGFTRYRHDSARADSLSSDAVTTLFEDRGGRLWIGTIGGGLGLHLGDGAFKSYRHDPEDPASLGSDRVLSLAEDSEGRLWLATDGGGLNRFHPLAFLRLQHDLEDASSLSSNELLAVHVDQGGRLWIGTKGRGLDRLASLDEATGRAVFENYSRADGLPDEQIWGIRSDASGALWLATNNGLSRLEPESGNIKSYDVSHGLQSNEFNLGAHFQGTGGELFFGGVGGLNAFFPKRIEATRHVPPVVLTSFTKINQPVQLERPLFDVSEIALDYRDYAFSLEFAVLDSTAPRRNRYRYRLEGFEDTWIDNGRRRWISFTNLDPGRYLLRVQGANSAGVWNDEGARVQVTVASPPWRSWWAYLLYALGLAAAIGVAVITYSQRQEAERERAIAGHERERVREREKLIEERERLAEEREMLHGELADSNLELAKKNAELERFNYTVTHDLKSPLVTIKGFLGMLERDIGLDDRERVEHDIRRVNGAADKMKRLLDELLELAQAGDPTRMAQEEVPLNDLVREALELIEGLTSRREVAIEVAPDLPVVTGDPVRLLQVYQNLLANAVKYMGDQAAPRVEVGVRAGTPAHAARPDPSPVYFVSDNGSGINPRFHQKLFELFERLETDEEGSGVGLAVVKRIVELHGGRVWVESEGEGHGSAFCFTLGDPPVEDQAPPVGQDSV